MLTETDVTLIRESYAKALEQSAAIAMPFYAELFRREPSLKLMFHEDITDQAGKLENTLQVALTALHAPESLVAPLQNLGRSHDALGVTPYHYSLVGEVLIDTVAEQAGAHWTPEASAAWSKLIGFVAETMLSGSEAEPPKAA